MAVLIAGCGDLGIEVGLRFAAAGERVVGLRRRPERLPRSIEGRAVDLAKQSPEIPADTRLLVVAIAPKESSEEAYRGAYVDGVCNVLDAVRGSGTQPKIIFVSSTAVYGTAEGGWVDERTLPVPMSPTAAMIRNAERRLHARERGAIVLRLGGLYGPGRRSLIDRVRSGQALIPQNPVYSNRIHRDDAAAAIVHLAGIEHPAPVYLGVDEEPADRGEVIRFLAREMGMAEPAESVAQRPRGANKRCCSGRLRSTGFAFEYPSYREGYRAILAGRGVSHR